jgi:hypothetical protein
MKVADSSCWDLAIILLGKEEIRQIVHDDIAYSSTCSTIYGKPTCNPIGRTPYVPQCIVTASHIPRSTIGYNQREVRRIDERPGR